MLCFLDFCYFAIFLCQISINKDKFHTQMKTLLTSIFYMPGVIIHEFSHYLFCIIFNAKVIKVCFYNFNDSSGYVLHERPKYLYQNVLISIAPFFINSLLGGLIAYPTVIDKLSITGLASLNWQDVLRIIISISIGMKAIPSKGDGLSLWGSINDSYDNFLLKIFGQIIIAPLVLIIYLMNITSSYLKIELLYGLSICFLGPKLIKNIIYLDIIQEFVHRKVF